MGERILVTGAAGFIGFHLCSRLLKEGASVTGLDSLNDYYDVNLKKARLAILKENPSFEFMHLKLEETDGMEKMFSTRKFRTVVNLAAQAGVRYSLENPLAYVSANLVGFGNILEGCRLHGVEHLVYASSSSVYGANKTFPFSEKHNVDHPMSLYAATKKSNELLAHSYSSIFGLPTTGLRFFTVYGPWGRPDMALFKFTKGILENKPIDVYNHGDMSRDFTYIDDIVDGVVKVMSKIPAGDPAWNGEKPEPNVSYAPYRVYNIGNNKPEDLMLMIGLLEDLLGKKAEKNFLPMQPGDIKATAADISAISRDFGFSPATSIREGIPRFVEWYRKYYGV
ncbi:MAG: NAD-dependent epimerase [Nitrospinae bacterium]|nr:NAD-dependent epimerase [Nitrospinota bacterium]